MTTLLSTLEVEYLLMFNFLIKNIFEHPINILTIFVLK